LAARRSRAPAAASRAAPPPPPPRPPPNAAHPATSHRLSPRAQGLLNQYLSSRINTELKVPPTQII